MRPEGIGRSGSLIASTWRSNQSFTAWLVPQTSGPESRMPPATSAQRPPTGALADTTPQPNAHIGANQVTGLSSSSTAGIRLAGGAATGAARASVRAIGGEIPEAIAAQLDVEALATEAEQLGGGGAVVARQLERRLDAEALDHVRRLAHELLQRDAPDELGQLLDRTRQFARGAGLHRQPRADIADGEAEAGLSAIPHRDG